MLDKLAAIHERYVYLEEQIANPEVIQDLNRYKRVNKEYKNLEPLVEAYLQYDKLLKQHKEAKEVLENEKDPEFREMAKMELDELQPQIVELEATIKMLLIPKDPEDDKDAILEIRSGTGGDEASLFAGDLYRMYRRYFERKGWRVEVESETEGTVGGYSKIVMTLEGENVYGTLKFESGAHRVQRIPTTEANGRIHTSAATVVVMPLLEMEDVNINRADLKVDTYRASGAGGQHINKTESAVRITHLPTGVVSESQDGRSQIKNREIALQRLYVKILEIQREAHESEVAQRRRSLVGSGDRSGKIRTYNFPQNRLTDHRINFTSHNLTAILDGDLEPVLSALQMADNAERMSGEQDADNN